MRYLKGHGELTRSRIVESAARLFRQHGVAPIGIVSLMEAAGLTHGGFYNHFESKEALVAAALGEGMGRRSNVLMARICEGATLPEVIASYLSRAHRDNPASGCMVATLAAEVARHSPDTRVAFGEGVRSYVSILALLWPPGTPDARGKAMALYSLMAGAMQLARATADAHESDDILASGRAAALKLAGIDAGEPCAVRTQSPGQVPADGGGSKPS